MPDNFFVLLLSSFVFLQSYKFNARIKSTIEAVDLRCGFRVSPVGIDVASPQLEWTLQAVPSSVRGLTQTAYQVLVASSLELLKKITVIYGIQEKSFQIKPQELSIKGSRYRHISGFGGR